MGNWIDHSPTVQKPPKEMVEDIEAQKALDKKTRGRGKGKVTLLKEAMRIKGTEMLSRDLERVLLAVLSKAKDGDPACAKMILDRALPIVEPDKKGNENKGFGGISITINKVDGFEAITQSAESSALIEGEVIEDVENE